MFGPQPRSYDFALPKKVERGALRAALAEKLQAGALVVVDALAAAEVKTKAAVELLKRLGVDGKACWWTWRSTRSCRGRCATFPACRSSRERARDGARRWPTRGAWSRRERALEKLQEALAS